MMPDQKLRIFTSFTVPILKMFVPSAAQCAVSNGPTQIYGSSEYDFQILASTIYQLKND